MATTNFQQSTPVTVEWLNDADNVVYGRPVVQSKYASNSANTVFSTIIAGTDAIPQITDGTEVANVAITPQRVGNIMRCRFRAMGALSTGGSALAAALFQSGSTNAIAASLITIATANFVDDVFLETQFTITSTAPVTLSIRMGATSGTWALNGNTVPQRIFGGASSASFIVEEIQTLT